jgi:hypothetical protein
MELHLSHFKIKDSGTMRAIERTLSYIYATAIQNEKEEKFFIRTVVQT